MTTNKNTAGQNRLVSTSKFLSLVLRHQPGLIGLTLDDAGWTPVDELLAKCAAANHALSREALEVIVRTSDKQRFALSEDGNRIRANQGHSVPVDLGLPPLPPPAMLLHGTTKRFLPSILEQGLAKRARHHVHLSESASTATAVGARRGESVLLKVDAARMHADGHLFYRSANGVWLTDAVPAAYLSPFAERSDMKVIKGDLLQLAVEGQFDVIVHGCNCQCQMGRGIALAIRHLFPEAYAADCATVKGDAAKLGTISVAQVNRDGRDLFVVNGYTQVHWRGAGVKADYVAVRSVMRKVRARFSGMRIGYPKIGAGLAGGDWEVIRAIVCEELAGEDHTFVDYVEPMPVESVYAPNPRA